MNNFLKVSVITLLLTICITPSFGQRPAGGYNSARFKSEPIWIQMMNDPEANYFETVRAFREFWKDYKLPGEPIELEGHDLFEKEVGLEEGEEDKDKEREKKRRRKSKEYGDYSFEVKQFKGWFRQVQPWVQADGHILSEEERQNIIDRQQNELKALERDQKN